MIETEQMGIVPEFNNNMRTKNFLRATLLAATLVVAGYGGMKAYDYSYAKRVNNDDAMLMANIEALTDGEEQPNIDDCEEAEDYICFALHPTDPSKDKEKVGYMWPED